MALSLNTQDESPPSRSSGLCAVCLRSMPLRKDGAVRVHGPVVCRCPGSGTRPRSAPPDMSPGPTTPQPSSCSQHPTAPSTSPGVSLLPRIRLLKRLPLASHDHAASKLSTVLEEVNRSNNVSAWIRLLNFPRRCFRVPGRGGRRWNLARLVNQQVAEENDPTPPVTPDPSITHPQRRASKSQSDPLHCLATRVSAKLEEGDFRGAVRLACSEDAVAEHNAATIAAMRAKHPAPHPDTNFPLPPQENEPQPPVAVTEQDVAQAVLSFPRGSAGGPDGLLPQHLKDLISNSARFGGKKLLAALTAFTNLVLSGNTPVQVRPLFFGATLTALNKKDGGVRPIAVGCTLRRMVAKVASRTVLERMGSLLAPLQLGFGTPLGAEAAAHSARVYLHHLIPDHVLLKLDFRNAFNSIRRDKMLEAARENIPELFHYVFSCYSSPSSLFFHGTTLQSAEGVQQGDPLGPLLFCLTIHPLITSLKSEFRVFYLDDGTQSEVPRRRCYKTYSTLNAKLPT